ncbi:hypothetical protein D3C79_1021100 [compost metagenome]
MGYRFHKAFRVENIGRFVHQLATNDHPLSMQISPVAQRLGGRILAVQWLGGVGELRTVVMLITISPQAQAEQQPAPALGVCRPLWR